MAMTDEQTARLLYRRMYRFMIEKDTLQLMKMLTDDFEFEHEGHATQDKNALLGSIADGDLHFFSEYTIDVDVVVDGDTATVTGKSRVTAAWFEIARRPWNFELTLTARNSEVGWQVAHAKLATFEE